MRLALTGVPGTGKTTVARALAASGVRVVHLNEFAAERDLVGDPDPQYHDAREVDLDALADALHESLGHVEREALVVVEGHFAHEMDVDAVVLLRCDPLVLVERLRARGWPEAKVRENVEAEALDVLAAEVLESGVPAVELDATRVDVEAVAARVVIVATTGPEASGEAAVGSARWALDALPWF